LRHVAPWSAKLLAGPGCPAEASAWHPWFSSGVVEKQLGLPATTRNWDTFTTVAELLGKP